MRKCALQLLSKLMCFNPFGKFLPLDQLAASLEKYKLELQVWFALHGASHLSVSTHRLHDECNMAEFGCCGQQKQQLQVKLAVDCRCKTTQCLKYTHIFIFHAGHAASTSCRG